MESKALTKSFIVNIKDENGSIKKLDFTEKMATKATMKLLINNIELESKENQQVLLKEYNGKVDVFMKPEFEDMLNNNDISSLGGYNATDIGQVTVYSRQSIQKALIPNFDILLSNGRIKDVLANETSGKLALIKLQNQKKQYARFDESAKSFIPWKVDLKGKKTAVTGATDETPTPALNKYIKAASTPAHNTVSRTIDTLQSGLRELKLSKTELATKGNFLKVIDKLIFYIQKLGIADLKDDNDIKIKSEGTVRKIGGTSRSDFTIYVDYDYLNYFTESGTFFIANTGKKLSISPEVGTYRGVKIIPKLMGKKPFYIVLNNSWTLQSFARLSTEISGGAGLAYNTGKAGSLSVKTLLPTERLLTISFTSRFIKPDIYTGPVWTLDIV